MLPFPANHLGLLQIHLKQVHLHILTWISNPWKMLKRIRNSVAKFNLSDKGVCVIIFHCSQ